MKNLVLISLLISIVPHFVITAIVTPNLLENTKIQRPRQNYIRFNDDGKLKIAIFADLHFGEEPSTNWGPIQDIRSEIVINTVLNLENPDFVVFSGDQITGENMYPNGSEYIHILVKPLVEKGYRWASTFGNHDIGPNVTRLELFEAEQTYSNLSYTMRMTNQSVPGITNYYLLIYPPESEDLNPVMIWWFFDSQGGRNNDGQQPHHIDPLVVAWFKEESQKLKDLYGALPSLAFFHIPPMEYVAIQQYITNYPMCSGLVDDDVTPQDKHTGILQALQSVGGVQTVFVGHDHGNGWCCYFGEIQVCYARHTGYGGYGSWERGSRIVHLSFDFESKSVTNDGSYIRLERGEIVDEFPNNKIF